MVKEFIHRLDEIKPTLEMSNSTPEEILETMIWNARRELYMRLIWLRDFQKGDVLPCMNAESLRYHFRYHVKEAGK
jgi:hypothetical protein